MVAKHPYVASFLNNICGAWYALGDSGPAKKKICWLTIHFENPMAMSIRKPGLLKSGWVA